MQCLVCRSCAGFVYALLHSNLSQLHGRPTSWCLCVFVLSGGLLAALNCWASPAVAPANLVTMLAALACFLCCCSARFLPVLLLMLGSLPSAAHCETYMVLVRCPGRLLPPTKASNLLRPLRPLGPADSFDQFTSVFAVLLLALVRCYCFYGPHLLLQGWDSTVKLGIGP